MNKSNLAKWTGILFITGSVLVNIPYTLLIMQFDYPDILRQPAADILSSFQQHSPQIIYIWLAFAWSGLPILFAIILLHKIVNRQDTPYLWVGTICGVTGAVTQIIGLLRWVFVVPVLSEAYSNPAAAEATRQAIAVTFQVVHHYGGVVIGEHIGQIFTIIWIIFVSIVFLKSKIIDRWLGWFGFVTSFIYLLGQSELLATVVPSFPVISEAAFIGSVLWLIWMVIIGIYLISNKTKS